MSAQSVHGARVVITGSTRGLGLCLAREFLSRGSAVMISGRTPESVELALAVLRNDFPKAKVNGFPCDVTDSAQGEALWKEAENRLGGVDHWILNAGIAQPPKLIWEMPPEATQSVIATDLVGPLYGCRPAMRGMALRGAGAIWFMEGHGSDGRIMSGLSIYGAAKRAIRYVAAALAVEAKGSGVLVGTLSPGIMITDFTMKQIDRKDAEARERTKKVFNILADRPETVAAFLVPRILATRRTGVRIAWLTTPKILYRFMTAGITKRKVIEQE
jgi:NAD(P)-dependent dehydrogenase (short-subunit alcohol dehydrogenase family)